MEIILLRKNFVPIFLNKGKFLVFSMLAKTFKNASIVSLLVVSGASKSITTSSIRCLWSDVSLVHSMHTSASNRNHRKTNGGKSHFVALSM